MKPFERNIPPRTFGIRLRNGIQPRFLELGAWRSGAHTNVDLTPQAVRELVDALNEWLEENG